MLQQFTTGNPKYLSTKIFGDFGSLDVLRGRVGGDDDDGGDGARRGAAVAARPTKMRNANT